MRRLSLLPRSLRRGASTVRDRRTRAHALDEVYTIMTFTAPARPEVVRQAVDARLDLPHDPPPLVGRLHIAESRPDRLRVALGSRVGTEWTGAATFRPDSSGGTTGSYRVTQWADQDSVLRSARLVDGMRQVREQIAAAVGDQGGSTTNRLVPASERR